MRRRNEATGTSFSHQSDDLLLKNIGRRTIDAGLSTIKPQSASPSQSSLIVEHGAFTPTWRHSEANISSMSSVESLWPATLADVVGATHYVVAYPFLILVARISGLVVARKFREIAFLRSASCCHSVGKQRAAVAVDHDRADCWQAAPCSPHRRCRSRSPASARRPNRSAPAMHRARRGCPRCTSRSPFTTNGRLRVREEFPRPTEFAAGRHARRREKRAEFREVISSSFLLLGLPS